MPSSVNQSPTIDLASVSASPGQEGEALAQVARALAVAGIDLPESLTLLAEQTRALLGAEGACIGLLEDKGFRVEGKAGTLDHLAAVYPFAGLSLSGSAVKERRVLIANQIASDARVDPAVLSAHGIRQVISAPMTLGDTVVGVLVAVNSERGAFTDADGALLQRMGDFGALAIRNGQLFRRAEQSALEAHALAEIVQHINQSLELDRVFALIARHAAELLHARGSSLGMRDGAALVVAAIHGDTLQAAGDRVPMEGTFAGYCLSIGRPAHTTDLHDDDGRWGGDAASSPPGRFNAVASPLRVGDRVIGVIMVFGKEAGDFDEHDVALLTTLSEHAAVAIENARLYRASVRTMRHAHILATSARSLAFNVTPRAMYADIGRVARASLRADGVGIYLAEPATGHVEPMHAEGVGAHVADIAVPTFWESAGGVVVRGGVPEFRSDVRDFPEERIMVELAAQGVASVAVLPLVVEGRPRGLLVLRYLTRQAFEQEQQQLLVDFSTHAALALRNALLFADQERRAARLAAVAQVQQAISAAVALDGVYTEIYRAVASVVDAPCFLLLLLDEEGDAFVPEYMVNDGEPVPCATIPRFPLGDGATSQSFRTGEPNITARSTRGWTGHSYEMEDDAPPIAVVLSAPIVHGERVLGVLQAQSYRHDAYSWEDVDLIMLIARQAGTAITNARTFEAERFQREQAEAAEAIARVALRASGVADAAEELLAIIDGAVAGSGCALATICQDGETLRYVAATGTLASRAGTTGPLVQPAGLPAGPAGSRRALDVPEVVIRLASGDRIVGALVVSPRDAAAGFGSKEHAALTRLAVPVALAFGTLLLRDDERRQQAQQRMMATALETLEQPVFVYGMDARIQYANSAAIREYQYELRELIGLHAQQLTVDPVSDAELRDIFEMMASAGRWTGERLARRRDGSEFPSQVTISMIRGPGDDHLGSVAIVRNLSEEQRVAEQLRQSEKLAALGELVAGVAHEVNNPLTGISALAQLLQDEGLLPDQLESVRLIKREADRAVAVIRDLLTFARKTGPRVISIDINELLEQTMRLRSYSLRTAGVVLDLTLASELWRVRGDDRQLQQVLLNLVVNAEHAMTAVQIRRLAIRTANEFDRVVVEIADSGVGMTSDIQKRIFEPFFTTKPEGSGTGLGLSVSYGIVQTHGGTLTVRSAAGHGTIFRLSLPAEADDSPHHLTTDLS